MTVGGVKGQDIQFCPEWKFDAERVRREAQAELDKTWQAYPGSVGLGGSERDVDKVSTLVDEINNRLERGGHIKPAANRPSSQAKRRATLESLLANALLASVNGTATIDDVMMMNTVTLKDHLAHQPWVAFIRMRGRYAQRPIAEEFSQDVLIEYVDAMANAGLLEVQKSDGKRRGAGLSSRFRATSFLIFLLAMHYLRPAHLIYARQSVVMKDVEKNYAKLPTKDIRLIGIVALASAISAYAASHDVAIVDPRGNDVTFDVMWEVVEKSKLRRHKSTDVNELICEMCDDTSGSRTDIAAMATMQRKHLYRVFNNLNIDHGGRFYGHFLQSIPKAWRRHATINGQPTTELDFASLHIHVCYAEAGIVPPKGDLYELKLRKANRKITKTLTLVLINCESRNSAVEAMLTMDEQRAKQGKVWGLTRKMINRYIDAITAKHHAIQRYFFSGFGVQAQNIDSRIAEKVLLDLMSQDVPCIPIHDSFVVPAENREQLRAAMDKACVEVIGRTLPIKQEY